MGAPKTQARSFLEDQWMPLNGWKKIIEKCLDNLVDSQMAFKLYHETIIMMLHKIEKKWQMFIETKLSERKNM